MQVESLAAVVVVVWFLPKMAGFGFGFSLPSSLPPSDSFSFASPCLHLPVPAPGAAGLWHPSAPQDVQVLGHPLGGEELPLSACEGI